jgi:hypothetical protein
MDRRAVVCLATLMLVPSSQLACGGETGESPDDPSCGTDEVWVDGVCVPVSGCPEGQVELPDGSCYTPPCGTNELLIDELCAAVGLPTDMVCPPGERPVTEGGCQPAGVPSDGCAPGFAHDGDRGCDAILPAAPCPPGAMAVPGDTECREVAPCGAGPWGDIPVDSTTVYVDQSYTGGASDGTDVSPWTSLAQAIAAAPSGAIVAVAAGSYSGSVTIANKPIQLWGRCPTMVALVGSANQSGAVNIHAGADGTELHNLALTGPNMGLAHFGSVAVVAEQLWIHDCGMEGIYAEDELGEATLTLSDSLIEDNVTVGVSSFGATLTVERSLIRGTQPYAGLGYGIVAAPSPNDDGPTNLTVRSSLIDDNHHLGVWISASVATLEATVVRGTLSEGSGMPADGIRLQDGSIGELSSLVVEDNQNGGLNLAGSETTVTSTVVRRSSGHGIYVEPDSAGAPGKLTLGSSLIEDHRTSGITLNGSSATLQGTAIRTTEDLGGSGIVVSFDLDQAAPSSATITYSLVERASDFGILVLGSDATIEATVVRDTQPRADGRHGSGMIIQDALEIPMPASGTVRSCLLEGNHELSVLVTGAQAVIEASEIRNTLPSTFPLSGRGVHAQNNLATGNASNAELYSTIVEQSHIAGVTNLDSDVLLDQVIVRDTGSDAEDGTYGDGVAAISELRLGTTRIRSSRISGSARAGCASFGARLTLENSTLACQPIDIDGEKSSAGDFEVNDQGGNLCGCPAPLGECQLLSTGIAPPPPLAD